jgi:hypothetical protein
MLANLSGSLALLVGLTVMLLPLLASELSRPRDAAWGAVVLLLGLTLVTSADRLTGSPMLAVLCGALLIGRLGHEVLQSRWRMLSPEEQQRLFSLERWQTSFSEVFSSGAKAAGAISSSGASVLSALKAGQRKATVTKRWVRAESEPTSPSSSEPETPEGAREGAPVVSSFEEIDQLLEASSPQAG